MSFFSDEPLILHELIVGTNCKKQISETKPIIISEVSLLQYIEHSARVLYNSLIKVHSA